METYLLLVNDRRSFTSVLVSLAAVRQQRSTQKANLGLLLLLLAFLALLSPRVFAEEPIAHPFIE